MKSVVRVGILLLLLTLTTGGVALADGSSGARSTDGVVKEWVDEFNAIGKKKPTYAGKDRQLALIKGMEFGPCGTALRFLSGLLKNKKAPGDQRLYALRALLRMADKKTFANMLSSLSKAKDTTLWDIFGRELLVRPSGAIREWAAGPALKSRDPLMLCAFLEARTRKVEATQAKAITKLFTKHVKSSGKPEVAFHALHALVRMAPKEHSDELKLAAAHADWRVRLAAADLLPSLEPFGGEVEAAVRTLIQDASPRVQQAALTAVGRYRRRALDELLIAKLNDPVARTRHVAVQALQTISGQKHGHDAAAWAQWRGVENPNAPTELEGSRYHGIEVHGDEVVFVVDASSSMTWPWEKDTHRIDVALSELKQTLGKLSPKTRFNVMVFAEATTSWQKSSMLATPENTAAASAWAATAMAKPAGDTFFYEAIKAALDTHPECDTVFLLTDGNPTAGRYWSVDGMVASVRSWTRLRRTAINTVGLSLLNMDRGRQNLTEKPAVMTQMLKAIAQTTGGEFREVLDAPK